MDNRAEINWSAKANYQLNLYAHYGAPFPNRKIYYGGGSITTGFAPINDFYEYEIDNDVYNQEDPLPISGMAYIAGANFYQQGSRTDEEVVILAIAGGIITGPAISKQTWIFTDTVTVQGLNETGK